MANISDLNKNKFMLKGPLTKQGYDWYWHSFTGINTKTKEEKSFFIEYFFINPALGSDEVILGQDEKRLLDKKKPSYMMVKAGCWGEHSKQIHNFIPWNEVKIDNKKDLKIISEDKQFILTNNLIKGAVSLTEQDASNKALMSDSGNMKWNLLVDKQIAFNVGYGSSSLFRTMNAFEMYWHSEGMKTEYFGTVELDGQTYKVKKENCYGYSDKNWGRDFTSPWLWLSSNDLISSQGHRLSNSVFSIGGGKPKVFGVGLDRKLLANIYYEGIDYEFNFSKFWTGCKTSFDFEDSFNYVKWNVSQENNKALYKATITCKKKDMLLINYEAPNGKKLHNKLFNGGTGTGTIKLYDKTKNGLEEVDIITAQHIGCEYGEYDQGYSKTKRK